MSIKERTVTWKTLISYGLGDIYGGGAFMIVGMLFLFYLTEVVGLSPALAGLVFGIGKVWDAVSDPLMGYLSDRTKSRFGMAVFEVSDTVVVFGRGPLRSVTSCRSL